MKSLKSNFITGGIYVSLIAAGYLIARYFDIPHFEISKSIDISNVSSLIATAWLAILISTVFEKKNNNNRVEKDLIISRVGDVIEIVASLQVEASNGSIYHIEASSSIKRINTSLNSIFKIVTKCHFDISTELQEKFKKNLSDLRKALTDTPVLAGEQIKIVKLPIEIKDGIIYFNHDRISQIEVMIDNLKDLLLELQIEINKK